MCGMQLLRSVFPATLTLVHSAATHLSPSFTYMTNHTCHARAAHVQLTSLGAAVFCVAACCRDDETGEEFSTCSWNLEYAKAYSVRARRNANVLVEFHLMAGFNKICPSVKVITKVTFGVLQICPGDIRAGEYLPLRAAGGQRLGTETCGEVARQGRNLAFAFKVNSPANSRNRCAVLQVETSDGYYQEMLLRYAD